MTTPLSACRSSFRACGGLRRLSFLLQASARCRRCCKTSTSCLKVPVEPMIHHILRGFRSSFSQSPVVEVILILGAARAPLVAEHGAIPTWLWLRRVLVYQVHASLHISIRRTAAATMATSTTSPGTFRGSRLFQIACMFGKMSKILKSEVKYWKLPANARTKGSCMMSLGKSCTGPRGSRSMDPYKINNVHTCNSSDRSALAHFGVSSV